MSFEDALKENGWSEKKSKFSFAKGNWNLVFDTSSWIEVGTGTTPRVFDVPVPEKRLYQWTINLIEHLCKTDDALVGKA
ncbi:hypothetical protein FKG94_16635 [Exilibacterium tricleocarpae]|uniref:Uncharacterized protein n=1 Tax=Exilibacterium tricleocarpae TaxID=2591008 RepID=A0A545TAI8_9GAMM|nr:hypothetical protein [Exilibacterium tricleocarpae]TQV74232.1 hypothetical protein FKG94_16635 [Exilibacterium tricleocarpae]